MVTKKDFEVEEEELMQGYRVYQAIRYYQMALDIKPNSQEVKQNIEMLFMKSTEQQQSQEGNQENDKDSSPQEGKERSIF